MTRFGATVLKPIRSRPGLSRAVAVVFLLMSYSACGSTPPANLEPVEPAPRMDHKDVLTLGRVSENPIEKIREWGPLVNYLADHLSGFDVEAGEVKVAEDIETMGRWMRTGEVELFIDSFYSTMAVADESGATPILYRHKDEPPKYTVFFTNAESGISTLDDLSGHKIALDDPESASGFMVPVAYMLEHGLNPIEKSYVDSPVSAEEVGYVFAIEDKRALRWVAEGRIAAGAVDNKSFAEFSDDNPGVLSIITTTEPLFGGQLLLASPTLEEPMRSAIKSVLANMSGNSEGRLILKKLDSSTFSESIRNEEGTLAHAEGMYLLVKNHIEAIEAED